MVSQQIIEIIIKAEDMASQQADKVKDKFKNIGDTAQKANDKASKASEKCKTSLEKQGQQMEKVVDDYMKVGTEGKKAFSKLNKSQQEAVLKFHKMSEEAQVALISARECGQSLGTIGKGWALNQFKQATYDTNTWKGSLELARAKMELMGNSTNTLREKIQTAGMAIPTYLGSKWDSIKTKVSSVSQTIKGKIGSAIDSVKGKLSGLTGGFNKLNKGTKTAANGLGFLKSAGSMAIGMIGYDLLNSFIESGRAAINSSSQLDYFGNRLQKMSGQTKLSAKGFKDFKTDLSNLQKEFRKVDMTAVGATAEEIAVKMNLPSEKLGDLTRMTAVLSSTFVKEGRTQEDAVLAVGDALDGQFRRLQEIGITQDTLKKNGWDGNLENQAGLIDALNKSMSEMGYEQTAKDITNLDEAFTALSVAGGQLISSVLIPITPFLIQIMTTLINLGDAISGFWNGLPDWAKIGIGVAALAVALGILVPALGAVNLASLPLVGTLTSIATAVMAISWPVVAVVAVIGLLVVAVYEVGKAFGWWKDVGSMLSAIQAGVMRLWNAFINHPDVQATISAITGALKWLSEGIGWAWNQILKFFNISTGSKWDIVSSIIHGIGGAWNSIRPYILGTIGILQSLYNFAVPIGQAIWNALRPIVCILLGCSPGIVPALEKVQEVFTTVWNAIVGFIGGVISSVVGAIQPIIDILSQIANFYLSNFIYAWQTLVIVFNIVVATVNRIIGIFSSFLSGQISLSTMLSMIWNTISVMFAKILRTIISRVRSWATNLITKAVQAGRGFVNGIINFIKNLPSRVAIFLLNTASRISSAMSSWITNAKSKASSMVSGVISNVQQLPGKVYTEFMNIGSRIVSAGSDLVNKAKNIGKNIVDGLLGAMGIHSPGIIQTKVVTEFKDMVGGVQEQMKPAGEIAKQFGETMVDQFGDVNLDPTVGYRDLDMPEMNMDIGMDTSNVESTNEMVTSSYDTLANMTGSSLQKMINQDKNAYALIRNNDSNQLTAITSNLQSNMSNMTSNVGTSLNNMLNKNKTGLNSAKNTTRTQLNNITTATVRANQKMIDSWKTMKTGIVSAADKIKSDSTKHFNALEKTIGGFYHKLQNPGGFGAGPASPSGRVSTVKRSGNNGFRSLANAIRNAQLPQYMSLGEIRRNPLVSNIDIGSYITAGKNNMFKVSDLIRAGNIKIPVGFEDTRNKGAGAWLDNVGTHVHKIKSTANNWKMKGPKIIGKYLTSVGFKVKDFVDSVPKIDYPTFKRMAEDVFSQCHYEFYWDSQKYGNWMTAFQHGGMNCSDSSDALIAMAHACGLPASKVHGHWNKYGHFWANVAGHKMDTTGWMNQRNWTPSASHAGPAPKTWSLEDLFSELKSTLETNNEPVIEDNSFSSNELILTGEATLRHEFLNLPENINAEEVARIVSETTSEDSWIKKLVKNVVFQKNDLREKARIESKNKRAIGA